MNISNTNFIKNDRLENPLFPMVCKSWNKLAIDKAVIKISDIIKFISFIHANAQILNLSSAQKKRLAKISQKKIDESKVKWQLNDLEKRTVLLLAKASQVIKASSIFDLFYAYQTSTEKDQQLFMKNIQCGKKSKEVNVLLQNFVHASDKKVKNQTILLLQFGLLRSTVQINEKFQSSTIYKLEVSKFIDNQLLQSGYIAIVENFRKQYIITNESSIPNDFNPTDIAISRPVKHRKLDESLEEYNKVFPKLPEDLILYLFSLLGLMHAPKVSLVNKEYRGIFELKYANPCDNKPIIWSKIELLKTILPKIRGTKHLSTYFRSLKNLTTLDSQRILDILTNILEVFDSYLIKYPNIIYIISDLFTKNAKGNSIKPALDRLLLRCNGANSYEHKLAIAYARQGDLKISDQIINKLAQPFNALEEILVESLIIEPNNVSDIIDEADRNCFRKLRYTHMKKLSTHLNSNQFSTLLQKISQIGLRNCLIHGCILSNYFDPALKSLSFGWEILDYTGLENWKENPYLHFIHASKKLLDVNISLQTQKMFFSKKDALTKDTAIKIILTVLRAYLKLDKMTEAEEIATLLNENIKIKALEFIAKKYAKMKSTVAATTCLNKLEELSSEFSQESYYEQLIKVAKIYALFDEKKAIKKLEEAEWSLNEVKAITESNDISHAFLQLAEVWMQIKPTHAVKLCKDNGLSPSSVSSLFV